MSSVFIALDLIRTPNEERSLSQFTCSRCGSSLRLHQPDEQLADRLVGTCSECLAWYLIDAGAGLMVLLPDEDDLRNS